MQGYVAGFAFHLDQATGLRQVALIVKAKPEWQRGKFNAVGGKIEPGETSAAAMVREFHEETGVRIGGWKKFCALTTPDVFVDFYRITLPRAKDFRIDPVEQVYWFEIAKALDSPKLIPNLRWLIPMALDDSIITARVHEGYRDGREIC